jgi:orotate phosphoribosyltransferase
MALRRGFSIKPGEKVLVVEDVITTGGSTKEVMKVIEDAGGVVVGIGSIIDRSAGTAGFNVRFASLAKVDIKTYEAESCPLCKEGAPAIKPGSRK